MHLMRRAAIIIFVAAAAVAVAQWNPVAINTNVAAFQPTKASIIVTNKQAGVTLPAMPTVDLPFGSNVVWSANASNYVWLTHDAAWNSMRGGVSNSVASIVQTNEWGALIWP